MRRLLVLLTLVVCAATLHAQRNVTVITHDYAFEMPDTLAAGLTTFRIQNEGQEPHEMVLVKLGENESLADFLAPHPPGKHDHRIVGGPAADFPRTDQSEATVALEAGRYAVVCGVPTVDHVAHVKKGMIKLLTVTPGASAASAPVSDLTITLVDYGFQFSKPLTPGKHTLRIVNAASQTHMMILIKYKPNQTTDSLFAWNVTRARVAPVEWTTGVSALGAGGTAYVNVDIDSGDYALLCFIDAPDGKDHFAHGMHQEIRIP